MGGIVGDDAVAFFSYSREDSSFALKLAADLKAAGANVWLDQLDIIPGHRWDRAVQDALINCSRMIVVLSPASVDSTNVMDEVSFALGENKTVIPVLYRDCTIPFRLRRVQHVDFRSEYARGFQEIVKTLGHVTLVQPGKIGPQPELEGTDTATAKRQLPALGDTNTKQPFEGQADEHSRTPRPNEATWSPLELKNQSRRVALRGQRKPLLIACLIILVGSSIWLWHSAHNSSSKPAQNPIAIAPPEVRPPKQDQPIVRPVQIQEDLTIDSKAMPYPVAISPDGRFLAFQPKNPDHVTLWDIAEGRSVRGLCQNKADKGDRTNSISISPNGDMIACGNDRSISFADVKTGNDVLTLFRYKPTTLFNGACEVDCNFQVAFSPDGKLLASQSAQATVKLWNASTGREITTVSPASRDHTAAGISFSPDGKYLAYAIDSEVLTLFEIATGRKIWTIRDRWLKGSEITFSLDGKHIAYMSRKGINIVEASLGKDVQSLPGSTGNVVDLNYSPDGRLLAAGYWEKKVDFWDMSSRKKILTLDTSFPVFSMALNPAGTILATGLQKGGVKLWNLKDRLKGKF
jgi:WD40 repeat protein